MLKYITSILLGITILFSHAQSNSRISEETKIINTYPFSDPDPNPILMQKKSIYPYHLFDGFSFLAKPMPWKVIKLENDFIEVYVLPEIGGKIWGAIEKSTKKEFIYRNEVIKFRNISMRGPWTSGGIEFNFGIIGHSPATATPVDYITKKNLDGSVSCFVGNMDLPSRTKWTVEIKLPRDKAYFETNIMWNNATGLPQNYYTYITAAAAVTKDAEFLFPGNKTIEHGGKAHPWPKNEENIDMSLYANDTFGSHNSFHTVGEYQDFMGGYFHKSDFGFGHWAKYEDMPGRKLWLWSTARDGAIWEDLLTDTDGQYMEFQAGRSFTQYSYNEFKSPIKELPFNAGLTDQWKELWFPVKEVGAFKEASPHGVLNVSQTSTGIKLGINSLGFYKATVKVLSNNKSLLTQSISLKPMQVYETSLEIDKNIPYEVIVEGMDLQYLSSGSPVIDRPFVRSVPLNLNSASHWYQEGLEMKLNRDYANAKNYFNKSLQLDPSYIEPMIGLAEVFYRSMLYDSSLYYSKRALELNTYHASANYFAGLAYIAKRDHINSLETFGWSARSLEYRSMSYANMALIKRGLVQNTEAEKYALSALDFNAFNLTALKVLSVIYRKNNKSEKYNIMLRRIKAIDELDDFVSFEKYLSNQTSANLGLFKTPIKNEFQYQTYLELAREYFSMGSKEEAIKVLNLAPEQVLVHLWKAYLTNDVKSLSAIASKSPAFVFPYRQEEVEILSWAEKYSDHWVYKYYLALAYWNMNREVEALALLDDCKNIPSFAPFYTARAFLHSSKDDILTQADLEKAKSLAPDDWRNWEKLVEYHMSKKSFDQALVISIEANKKFEDNFMLSLQYARVLLNNKMYDECATILSKTKILPFEGSNQGKEVLEQLNLLQAISHIKKGKFMDAIAYLEKSKEWPERLGSGKPYLPNERLQDFLEVYSLQKLGKAAESSVLANRLVEGINPNRSFDLYNVLGLSILKKKGDYEALQSAIKTFKSQGDFSTNVISQWIVAKITDDKVTLATVATKLDQNKYFEILTDALDLLEQ